MKKSIYVSAYALAALFLSSCTTGKQLANEAVETQPSVREYSVQSVMWQQNAGEYRALCYQAFNTAKFRLDQFLENKDLDGQKLAIVTDIDETVLDNSPYNAKLIEIDEEYTSEGWKDWTDRAEAEAIPGAEDFLNYAASKGVEVFYVTNRNVEEMNSTLDNLKKVNFPFSDDRHILLRSNNSAKRDRFNKVAEEYTILLFMGDNLGDFTSDFMIPSTEERNKLTDDLKEHFGYDYIVLPNPMYGDWETHGIYQENYNMTDKEKDEVRKASLRTYE